MSQTLEPTGVTPKYKPLSTLAVVLICVIASIGFAFDIYELLMLPLILRPAAFELTGILLGTSEWTRWLVAMFWVPAFLGGLFGLLGGYLTGRFGRRRVLMYSILLYAVSAFLAGYSTSMWMLLVLRCTTFIGVCVEFVAAIAWLAELFTTKQKKETVLGWTQAFSSVGGLMVAWANSLALRWAAVLAVMIISRRRFNRMLLIPGLFLLPFAFYSLYLGENRTMVTLGSVQITYLDGLIFLAGLFTVGQFSFWGHCLPRVFPVPLRGTGESFAANIGGRMIGTSMAFITSTITSFEMFPAQASTKICHRRRRCCTNHVYHQPRGQFSPARA